MKAKIIFASSIICFVACAICLIASIYHAFTVVNFTWQVTEMVVAAILMTIISGKCVVFCEAKVRESEIE